jgi:hypothetical protein
MNVPTSWNDELLKFVFIRIAFNWEIEIASIYISSFLNLKYFSFSFGSEAILKLAPSKTTIILSFYQKMDYIYQTKFQFLSNNYA